MRYTEKFDTLLALFTRKRAVRRLIQTKPKTEMGSMETHLEVFDTKGEKVMALMDEFRETGVHSVKFDAAELSSGVYLYTLSSGGRKLTKKMLLIR